MKTKALAITSVSLVAAALTLTGFSSNVDEADAHEYTIGIEGAKDVQLRMYLVAKRSTKSAPTLQEQIVTVPFETKFKAHRFYVWFHTLEGETSANGSRIRSVYKIDGELQGAGFGLRVNRGSRIKTGFGNL